MAARFLHLTLRCAVLAAVASMVGCATTASITTLQPIEENLSQYKNAVVMVAGTLQVQSQDGFQYAQARLKFGMIGKLRASKKFQDVTDGLPPQPADYDLKIVVTVTSLGSERPGGGWGPRVGIGVGGVFSGGAAGVGVGTPLPGPGPTVALIVQVELFNAKTNRRLGYMDASATSGDTAAQAEAIADKVVAEITAKGK